MMIQTCLNVELKWFVGFVYSVWTNGFLFTINAEFSELFDACKC